MPCTYTLQTPTGPRTFTEAELFMNHELQEIVNKALQGPEDQYDIPETYEEQRNQFVARWHLKPMVKEGQSGYVTSNGKVPTLALAKRMAEQLKKRSGEIYDKLRVRYDATYGLIQIGSNQLDGPGPSYDFTETHDDPSFSRTFHQLPDQFRLNPGEVSRYLLSPTAINTDTYTNGGEYFNLEKKLTGTATQLASRLKLSPEQFKEAVAASKIAANVMKDFLDGKTAIKLTLYKVDRVADPELFFNGTEDTQVATLRQSKIVQRNSLRQRARKESDPERKQELFREANRVNQQVRELHKPENQNIGFLRSLYLQDKEAYGLTKLAALPDIDYLYRLFSGYQVLFQGLDLAPFGEQIEEAFRAHLAEIDQIKRELAAAKKVQSIQEAEFKTGVNLSDGNGNLLPVKDINSFAGWTLALSTTQSNPLVRYIAGRTNFAINRSKDKTTSLQTQLKPVLEALQEQGKQQGIKGISLFNYMLETDKDGKPNGHFVIKYGDFYQQMNKMIKEGKGDDKSKIISLLSFLSKNTKAIEKLEEEFKKAHQAIYESSLEKIKLSLDPTEYNDQTLHEMALSQADRIAYGINPDNFTKLVEKFRKTGKIDDKDIVFVNNFLQRGAFHKYLHVKPNEEFIDKKYAAIEALPDTDPRKQFYHLFTELHYEVAGRVREDDISTLRRNFIAEFRRDYKNEDEDMVDYLKREIHDWGLNMLTENPRDNIQGFDPLTREIIRAIPFYSFDGRIEAADKNYNLGKVLLSLAQEYYKYDALSEAEDDLLMMEYLLRQVPVYETNSFGKPIMMNNEPVIKNDTSAMYKQAEYHILATLYNDRQKKDGIGTNKYYTYDTKQRIQEMDDQVKAGTPLTKEQEVEYKELKATYQAGTVKKGTNALLQWTSMKNIGFNLFGGLAEIFQGTASLYLRYGSKAWVSTTIPTLLRLVNPQDSVQKHKLSMLQRMFHIESDLNPNMNESKFKKVAYYFYGIARRLSNTAYLIAELKSHMIADKEGTEHSLYDVMEFDETGKILLPSNFDNPFYNPDGSYSDYKYKLQQLVNKAIRQNRDRETDIDPIQLDQHFWGRLLGQFKASWLFEGFATRFGSEHAPLNDLDSPTKGIYRSFWELSKAYTQSQDALGNTETRFSLPRSLLKAFVNILRFSSPGRLTKGGQQRTNEATLDYEGAVRAVREVQTTLFLYGMVMLVGGMASGDDKDKWKKRGLTYLTNYFMRTQRDMSNYFDPQSLASIINHNIVPSLGTLDQSVKLLEDPFRGIFNDNWYYNQGKSNEQLRLTRDAADLIPLINQFRSTLNKLEKNQAIFY